MLALAGAARRIEGASREGHSQSASRHRLKNCKEVLSSLSSPRAGPAAARLRSKRRTHHFFFLPLLLGLPPFGLPLPAAAAAAPPPAPEAAAAAAAGDAALGELAPGSARSCLSALFSAKRVPLRSMQSNRNCSAMRSSGVVPAGLCNGCDKSTTDRSAADGHLDSARVPACHACLCLPACHCTKPPQMHAPGCQWRMMST